MTRTAKATDINIRWMIRRDEPQVIAIERQCPFGWTRDGLWTRLRDNRTIAVVAEEAARRDQIVGYAVYSLRPRAVILLRLAVDPAARRRGVGRAILTHLRHKLSHQRRDRILAPVHESNLAAHLFFRACGYQAITVLRGYFGDQDGYGFRYKLERPR